MKTVWKQNLLMLWLSQVMVMAGYDALNPFIPLFLKEGMHLAQPTDLALYVAAYASAGFIGYGIANPIWGWLGDRYGMKAMLLRGTFLTSLFWPMMAYVHQPSSLVILRGITAFLAGTTVGSQMMIARTAPLEKQGFALGMITSAVWTGSILGNILGGLLIHYYSYKIAFWGCGITYFLAGFFILFTHDSGTENSVLPKNEISVQKEASRGGFGLKLPATTWLIILLFFITGLFRRIDLPYMALRIEGIMGKEGASYWTGIASAVIGVASILSGIIFGKLIDRYSANQLILPILIGTIFFTALQGINPGSTLFSPKASLLFFTVSRSLVFFIAGAITTLTQKELTRLTPKNQRGLAYGLSTTAMAIGGILASTIGGILYGRLGILWIYFGTALVTLLATPPFKVILHHVRPNALPPQNQGERQ